MTIGWKYPPPKDGRRRKDGDSIQDFKQKEDTLGEMWECELFYCSEKPNTFWLFLELDFLAACFDFSGDAGAGGLL